MRRACPVGTLWRMSWWAKPFAAVYEASLWPGEIAGMRRRRRELLAQAHGCVLEIGAGTGINLPHYPAGLSELILTEPADEMRAKLEARAAGATVVAAPAEQLPVAAASVDTVVSTFVLCTVDDPVATLQEVKRVLRPGGQLLLIEHVRSDSRWLARLQRLSRRPWRSFACGCRCDQPTEQLVRDAGFRVELRHARWRAMPPVIAPIIVGRALV